MNWSWCVRIASPPSHLHVVVLLVHSLQVLLELLQLNEAVVCQLPALLHLTVHFFKLERREEERKCQ